MPCGQSVTGWGVEQSRRGEFLSNRYGSDAARPRSVAVRRTVATAARAIIAAAGWEQLDLDGGGFEAFMDAEPAVADPEPDYSTDESDDTDAA